MPYQQLSDSNKAFSEAAFQHFRALDIIFRWLVAFFKIDIFCDDACAFVKKCGGRFASFGTYFYRRRS
jgi:hypothetical protein